MLKDISSIRIFCKDIHETLKYVDEFWELKKMTKLKKNISLSLSLYLSICRCTLISRKGVHVPVSLSFSDSPFTFAKTVWIQIRPECNSGKNVSSIKKMCLCAIESTQSVVQKPMRTIKWVLSVYIVRSHARIQRGNFLAILDRIPWNSQNYQASIQRWAIIGTPVKHHLKASLAGRWWPAFSDIWILFPLKKKIKNVVRVLIMIRSEWNSGKNVSSI